MKPKGICHSEERAEALSRANLEGARVELPTLAASTLTGATMPDGTAHD